MGLINLKKQRELDFLLLFKKSTNYNFKIENHYPEPPDFIISYNNKKIGIELTEYFIDLNDKHTRGSQLKSKESIKQGIVNRALKYYKEQALPPIRVWVNFLPGLIFSKAIKEKISQILYERLSNIKLDICERENILGNDYSNNLSTYFKSVQVLRIPDKFENYWTIDNWSFVANLSKETISDIIRRKEEKIKSYKEPTDSNWLLIVSDRMYPSSKVGISEKFNFRFDSKFDKIFFLTYPEVRTFKLK